MGIRKTTKAAVQTLLGPRLTGILSRQFRPHLSSIGYYRSALRAKRGLEIGGPSPMLAEGGSVPIYDVLTSLDNCLYSGDTIWTGMVHDGETFVYQSGKEAGTQIICDATDLQLIEDRSYDCVLACHCLEHVANPLRALAEWKRVLRIGGLLLLVLPHKDGTFDWRRPTTPLRHMIEDYENAVGEDDLTHVPEILELHDLSRDEAAGTREQFERRCLANLTNRAMHHHVFDTMAALAVVDYIGFEIQRIDNLNPCHIVILARRTNQPIDNRRYFEPSSEHWRRSPFPSDHRHD
jgi:SAM-dependent methyltransferase